VSACVFEVSVCASEVPVCVSEAVAVVAAAKEFTQKLKANVSVNINVSIRFIVKSPFYFAREHFSNTLYHAVLLIC
jgi:hypothetical protein